MKDYLFRKKLSPKQFAADLNISTSYLYQLMRGERKPSLELAQKIEAITFGELSVAMLMGLEDKKEPTTIEERLQYLEDSWVKLQIRLKAIEGRLSKLETQENQ